MPIYEFECTACGNVFDRLQKLSDLDPDTCPNCGKKKIHRCVTAPSFRLSGSGWYETDFKKDNDKKRNLTGKDDAPKSDVAKSDSDKSTQSKPDIKPKPESAPAAKVEKSKT
ncbi:MAG TPA: zinc ribbon domain-containing protein [Rudaea sp.]|nr:zinc ribbon domain-containing protein [Rudaea sp.]